MPIVLLTVIALLAFAANSILCRIALGNDLIDPAGFTIVRLLSASITLYGLFVFNNVFSSVLRRNATVTNEQILSTSKGSWLGSICLFIYAASFSYAYLNLDTGTGALILFGTVQIFMISYSVLTGNRLLKIEWAGLIIAFLGFVYLILPQINTPSASGLVLMTTSGLAWAGYTIIGKRSNAPLMDTSYNFFRTIPFVLVLTLFTINTAEYSLNGIWLAIASGAIMSGLGYAAWYAALKNLTATQAGVLQLSVPIIAALGGIVFMQEHMTVRLALSILLVIGGIALVLLGKKLFK
jgi:drug/metabolite transporter (DMT)-like permease